MTESLDPQLLDYYQRELAYLRYAGSEFALHHPKIAQQLQLSDGESPDPQVERLLESFALLTARLQRRLDDNNSELSNALLEQLYPHALRPIPSCAIACFQPDTTKGSLASGYLIPRDTHLFVTTTQGDTLNFRSRAEQTLWPLQLENVSLLLEKEAQAATGLPAAQAALVLRLHRLGKTPLSALAIKSLRIHLSGSPINVATLYDLLAAHSIMLGCRLPEPPVQTLHVCPGALPTPVGFHPDDALLPLEDGQHPAHGLLTEYFACPEKFAFFDLSLNIPAQADETLDIVIAFDCAPVARVSIQQNDIMLGCVPVINLFPLTSEPLRPDATQSEYPLVADAHRYQSVEIYAIRKVRAATATGVETVPPYFSCLHGQSHTGRYWHARRVNALSRQNQGSDMLLTLVDTNFNPHAIMDISLTAELLCTNRHLAEQLPAGTPLSFEQVGPVAQIHLLRPPRPQTLPTLEGASRWKLVSQLALNHLSFVEGEGALNTLKEMLTLHNLCDHASARQQIDGISTLRSERISEHVGHDAWRGWRNGLHVCLELEPAHFVGSSAILFASVLAHFFALYAHTNRFVHTSLLSKNQEIKTWRPSSEPSLIL